VYLCCIRCTRRLRQEFVRASADLNDAAHQFRVIEKRLLVRFKVLTYSALHSSLIAVPQLLHINVHTACC
jgi:PTHB1 C-terminus